MNEDTVIVQEVCGMTAVELTDVEEQIAANNEDTNELTKRVFETHGWKAKGAKSFKAWAATLVPVKLSYEAQTATIRDFTKLGMKKPEVAAVLGVSEDTVQRANNPKGTHVRPPQMGVEPEYYPAAAGLSLRESAAATGAHHATVGRDLSEAAVAKATPASEPEHYPQGRVIDHNDPEEKALTAGIDELFEPMMQGLTAIGVPFLVPCITEAIEHAVERLREVAKPTRRQLDMIDTQIEEMTKALEELTLIRTELEWKIA